MENTHKFRQREWNGHGIRKVGMLLITFARFCRQYIGPDTSLSLSGIARWRLVASSPVTALDLHLKNYTLSQKLKNYTFLGTASRTAATRATTRSCPLTTTLRTGLNCLRRTAKHGRPEGSQRGIFPPLDFWDILLNIFTVLVVNKMTLKT